MEPLTLIAPFTAIIPPAEIACTLTPEPVPVEPSVIAIKVMFCFSPLVLSSVSVGLRFDPVTLNVKAVDWVMLPDAIIVTLVPALMAF